MTKVTASHLFSQYERVYLLEGQQKEKVSKVTGCWPFEKTSCYLFQQSKKRKSNSIPSFFVFRLRKGFRIYIMSKYKKCCYPVTFGVLYGVEKVTALQNQYPHILLLLLFSTELQQREVFK